MDFWINNIARCRGERGNLQIERGMHVKYRIRRAEDPATPRSIRSTIAQDVAIDRLIKMYSEEPNLNFER